VYLPWCRPNPFFRHVAAGAPPPPEGHLCCLLCLSPLVSHVYMCQHLFVSATCVNIFQHVPAPFNICHLSLLLAFAMWNAWPGTWLMEHPRPLDPTHVLTGPGSPRQAHTLVSPADATKFVGEAKQGLILVGFGTGKQQQQSFPVQS
jgi:hypothetical protein